MFSIMINIDRDGRGKFDPADVSILREVLRQMTPAATAEDFMREALLTKTSEDKPAPKRRTAKKAEPTEDEVAEVQEDKPAPKRRTAKKAEPTEDEVAEVQEDKDAKLKAAAAAKDEELAKAKAEAETADETEEATEDDGTPMALETEDEAEPAEELSVDDVVAKVTSIVQAGGRDKVKSTLEELGYAKVSAIPAGERATFLSALEG